MSRRLPSCSRIGAPRLGLALLIALLAGCVGNPVVEKSRYLAADGQPEAALDVLGKALKENPDDRELRNNWLRQRNLLVAKRVEEATQLQLHGKLDEAEKKLRAALALDPQNQRAQVGLADLAGVRRREARLIDAEQKITKGDLSAAEQVLRAVMAEDPANLRARDALRRIDDAMAARRTAASALKNPFAKPVTLEFRDAPLRTVFEVLSRTAGINFVFDKDVKPDTKVTVFVRNTTIEDVIRLVLVTNQLDRKLINDNSVLIYPATAAKQKDFQDLVTRTFLLTNGEAKQAQALIKQIVKSKDVFVDDKLNLLVVKDTPDAIRLAERLIQAYDVPESEVLLDVEVLEISRDKTLQLGLKPPTQIGYGLLGGSSTVTSGSSTGLAPVDGKIVLRGTTNIDVINANNLTKLYAYVANPLALLDLSDKDSQAKVLANPSIRVKNHAKAKIHVGDKIPVFTTTSTANVGVSASVNYLDVGLKLEVEPSISLDDEVTINVGLEVSTLGIEVKGPADSSAYQVGTRTANTVLQLKNGETQVLAGLISSEDRKNAVRIPGLGDVPAVGRLFSSSGDYAKKTEIVLLITPRIVRNLPHPDLSLPAIPSGTDTNVGAPPLLIGATAPGGLAIKGGTAGSGGPAAPIPRTPIPSDAPPDGAGAASLGVPERVALGAEFDVHFEALAPGLAGCELDISFDGSLVQPAGGAAGAGSLHLAAPGGGGRCGSQARFRVIAGKPGSVGFEVSSLRAHDASGGALNVPPPASASVMLGE